MGTFQVTGSVTDSAGAVNVYNLVGTIDGITVTSVTISPDPAPVNTLRTLTVVAASSAGLPVTFATPTIAPSGPVFTPVSGQPAGTAKWTFTV